MKIHDSMDKEHFRGQLSTKTPLFMDKGVLLEDLSMKRPDSMDRKGLRGGLSAKGSVSMDREEKRLCITGGMERVEDFL